jgi:hypothetical protein
MQYPHPTRESVTAVPGVDAIYTLGRAVESIRSESGPAVVALDRLSPQRIGSRIDAEFCSDSLGELIRRLAFVIEISSSWV